MRTCIIVLVFINALCACAQTKFSATNKWAFFRKNIPGALLVDDNNEPVNPTTNLQYFVYIESPATVEVKWNKAWIGSETYDISSTVAQPPLNVGEIKNKEEEVNLSVKPGNKLWQLELQKGKTESKPAKLVSVETKNKILIKGTLNKRDVFMVVDSISELKPLIYP